MTNLETFRPAWWLPGSHAQTLGARMLRRGGGVKFTRERVELPDGDFLDLDWVGAVGDVTARSDTPLVVMLHGLEGCAQSTYALEIYRVLIRHDVAAVGMNFRSCSGEPNRLPRLYHSGDTGDIAHVLTMLRSRFPRRRLGAVGFSLGGNVLLKYLGERGAGAGITSAPLQAAAAISVPFDLSRGADYLERGFSRVYRQYLLKRLQGKVRAKIDLMRDHVDLGRVLGARTFREFDDAATAVLHGFQDAEDYYRRSSSGQFLTGVGIPTLIIHSRDDPFLPRSAVPSAAVRDNPHLTGCITPHGGHVGFVGGPPWAPAFWAERQAGQFLALKLHHIPDRVARTPRGSNPSTKETS